MSEQRRPGRLPLGLWRATAMLHSYPVNIFIHEATRALPDHAEARLGAAPDALRDRRHVKRPPRGSLGGYPF